MMVITTQGNSIPYNGYKIPETIGKDPYVKHLSKGMSNNQKEHFQREIEDLKHREWRGENDNLTRDLLKEIAEWIKKTFK